MTVERLSLEIRDLRARMEAGFTEARAQSSGETQRLTMSIETAKAEARGADTRSVITKHSADTNRKLIYLIFGLLTGAGGDRAIQYMDKHKDDPAPPRPMTPSQVRGNQPIPEDNGYLAPRQPAPRRRHGH